MSTFLLYYIAKSASPERRTAREIPRCQTPDLEHINPSSQKVFQGLLLNSSPALSSISYSWKKGSIPLPRIDQGQCVMGNVYPNTFQMNIAREKAHKGSLTHIALSKCYRYKRWSFVGRPPELHNWNTNYMYSCYHTRCQPVYQLKRDDVQ